MSRQSTVQYTICNAGLGSVIYVSSAVNSPSLDVVTFSCVLPYIVC